MRISGKGNRAHLFLKMFLVLLAFCFFAFLIMGAISSTAAFLQDKLGYSELLCAKVGFSPSGKLSSLFLSVSFDMSVTFEK